MLRRTKDFENYTLRARDGDIGRAKEFYFDDQYWTVRYLVAATGGWLSGRKVLISPHSLNPAIGYDDVIPVDLTRQQIEDSPPLSSDQPVSRQFEQEFHEFYGWPYYGNGAAWGGSPFMWVPNPAGVATSEQPPDVSREEQSWDPCLRSTHEVCGYRVRAVDGEIGHVEDFIIDEESWSIRYLVVDTQNWWPGKHVLISQQWIEDISWDDSKVFTKLTKEAIQQSPEYTHESLNRGYEEKLHAHYNAHGYWENQPGERAAKEREEAMK